MSILTKGQITRINSVKEGIACVDVKILYDDFLYLACPSYIGKIVESLVDTTAISLALGKIIPQSIWID